MKRTDKSDKPDKSTDDSGSPVERAGEWLMLLYYLPAKQAHARVQAWRRLHRLGAVALKNSAYVLPYSAEADEDFQWIKNEIVSTGGQAMILIARTLEQATRDEIVSTFRAARAQDFNTLAAAASRLLETGLKSAKGSTRRLPQAIRRLREQFEEASRIDFFGTPEREQVAELLTRIDARTRKATIMKSPSARIVKRSRFRGKVWVTRPRPGVDRMSSAWLIRRFIDPAATFVFTDPARTAEAIPFDTYEAEFGHHGTHCTFETLCERFSITDPGALWIGRIVHDLDLKEDKFDEAETPTVGRLVEGLRRAHHDDDALLGHGMATFEALYQAAGANVASSRNRRARTKRR